MRLVTPHGTVDLALHDLQETARVQGGAYLNRHGKVAFAYVKNPETGEMEHVAVSTPAEARKAEAAAEAQEEAPPSGKSAKK